MSCAAIRTDTCKPPLDGLRPAALAGYLLHPTRFMRGGSLPGTKFASPGIHDADFAKAPQQ